MLKPFFLSSFALLVGGCASKTATPEAAPAAAETAAEAAPTPAAKSSAVTAADVKWMPIYADRPEGPKMSLLTGNPKEGAFTALVKLPAGAASELHSHPSTFHGVVVAGTMKNGRTADDAAVLNVGDLWTQPSGEVHFTGCTEDADCIFAGRMEGAMGTSNVDSPADKSTQIVVAAADIDFQPMNPEQPDGPKLFVITGDMKTGPWTAVASFPAGLTSPLHSHSASYSAAVVAGDVSTGGDVTYPAGSTWSEKNGTVHVTGCAEGEEDCVFFVSMDGAMDMIPAEPEATEEATEEAKAE